jgi:hypothetical protein
VPPWRLRAGSYEVVTGLVRSRVRAMRGRISARRLLAAARAAGCGGSGRDLRRLVGAGRSAWRAGYHRGRRPAVWSAGGVLVIGWGSGGGLRVFCVVLVWGRLRLVRFAADERAQATFALLAGCLEVLGGVPKMVLADRMGCLEGGVVATKVVPAPGYVRFATRCGFRPGWCEAAGPGSRGAVGASSATPGVTCWSRCWPVGCRPATWRTATVRPGAGARR